MRSCVGTALVGVLLVIPCEEVRSQDDRPGQAQPGGRSEGPSTERIAEVVRDLDGDGHVDRAGEAFVLRAVLTGPPVSRAVGQVRGFRFYVQDLTGGLRVESEEEPDASPGAMLELRGVLGEYRGMPTFDLESMAVVGSNHPLRPEPVSLGQLDRERSCGLLVQVRGGFVAPGDGEKHVAIRAGEDRLRLFLRPAKDYASLLAKLKDGDELEVVGHLEQYTQEDDLFGGYRLRPRSLEDVQLAPRVEDAGRTWPLLAGLAALLFAASGLFAYKARRSARRFETPEGQRMHALGTMAGGVAHEFNNYLLAIKGFAELARDELPEGSEGRQHVNEVLAASSRAKALIDQILSFSRTQPDELVPLDLAGALRESMRLLRGVMPASVQIVERLSAGSEQVVADAGQISQVILNLGSNASNAMPGGGVLTVTLERAELSQQQRRSLGLPQAPAYALIEFSDTGCGMSKDVRSRAFDPFFTTRRQAEGTGLGLSVVHGIVKRHRGAIDVHSVEGKGSTFRIYLPILGGEAVPAPASEPAGEAVTALEETTGSEVDQRDAEPVTASEQDLVLVVDDQRNLTALVERLLGQLGMRTKIANDGRSAVRALEAAPEAFSLVLSDLAMPGMTGVELAHRVRELRPGLPFVLMTGNATALEEQDVAAAGIRRIVNKPFGLEDLRDLFDDVLSRNGRAS